MARIHNFSAGPAVLPVSVLEQAQQAIMELGDTGLGLLECSHRSKAFDAVATSAVDRLGRLLGVSETHHVLFLQGGASTQFFMVPMNLLRGGRATYLDTGRWSANAIKEAQRFGTVDVPFSSKGDGYTHVPAQGGWGELPEGTAYVHYTSNNTVAGTQFPYIPETGDVPLVTDASSDILSDERDWSKHAIVYAGAQKNLGPSGMAVVAIRKDLIDRCDPDLPTMLRYGTHAAKDSMFNTPPTFAIYMVERVAAWIEESGGLAAVGERNRAKAGRLYGHIDSTDFWQGKVREDSRSIMNPTFTTGNDELDTLFHTSAAKAGLSGLKGHRSVGGLRASIYNACPDAAVDALIDYMREFERTHG